MERVPQEDVLESKSSSNTYRIIERNIIVSPSLVYQGDFSDPLPEGFEAFYMHLLEEDHSKKVVDEDTELDNILIQASQLYEASGRKARGCGDWRRSIPCDRGTYVGFHRKVLAKWKTLLIRLYPRKTSKTLSGLRKLGFFGLRSN